MEAIHLLALMQMIGGANELEGAGKGELCGAALREDGSGRQVMSLNTVSDGDEHFACTRTEGMETGNG